MGARIDGVDLETIDDACFSELTDALYHHKMVFFRDQTLSLEGQERLTRRFGEFGVDAYTAGVDGHPNVQRVLKQADERSPLIFGGSWHTDSPFLERPPAVSLLYAVDVPPYGGDTLWANSALAYATLSPLLQSMLAPLRVRMSGRRVMEALERIAGGRGEIGIASMDVAIDGRTLVDGTSHPLVRTHPVTGEKSLYVDETYAVGIDGLSDYESGPLLAWLCAHVTQPVFQCRLRWTQGTFAMWDNRTTIHHAFNDHDGYRREMLRTIAEGEIPV